MTNTETQEQIEAIRLAMEDDFTPEEIDAAIATITEAAGVEGATLDKPMDLGLANWILGKMARAKVSLAEIDQMHRQELEAITARAGALEKPHQATIEFLEARYGDALQAFAKSKIEGTKTRSVGVINGKFGFRAGREKLVFDRPEEEIVDLLEQMFASESEQYVRVAKSIKKDSLATLLQSGGGKLYVAIPGDDDDVAGPSGLVAHLEKGADTFYIDPELPR